LVGKGKWGNPVRKGYWGFLGALFGLGFSLDLAREEEVAKRDPAFPKPPHWKGLKAEKGERAKLAE